MLSFLFRLILVVSGQALGEEAAASAVREAELRAGVSRWRDEAGLAAQRERQVKQGQGSWGGWACVCVG